jgi:two-component sensor histidine kinase
MVGLPVTQTSMDFAEWLAIVHPDDRGLAEAALAETITAQAGTSKSSYRIIRPDGSVRWLELSVHTTRDALGQPIELDGVALDVTEQRQEDERKREIVREMHHRIRNNLAVVQALARQTAREETDVQSFAERLVSRLGALSATHDLLIKDSGRGVSLADLLLTETGPFEVKQDKRIMLEGPDVIVPQSMLVPLTLMFHELTTNSAKYGSLACEDGQLRVTWSTAADADRPQLSVVWSEQGGLTTAVPPRTGFGSGLIRRMVNNALGGEVEFLWQPEGLRCAFAIPLVS